ncbi:MAG: hypothetical protein CMF55_01675 [Legionellales bacterium]|nr:hypothetical protein [Legionellales bacterium]HAG62270.1 hypothetical protein [Coxiellaceae bacterium]
MVLAVIQSSTPHALSEVLLKQDTHGRTALHYCLARLPLDVIDALFEKVEKHVFDRALVRPDINNQIPLHVAILKQSPDLLKAVIKKASSRAFKSALVKKDRSGFSPLYYAITQSSQDIALAVINSATPHSLNKTLSLQDAYGQTALHDVIARQPINIIRILINKMGKSNVIDQALAKQDRQGQTLVHLAILSSPEMLSAIIRKSDEPELFIALVKKNQYGHTPLYYAAKKGSDHLMQQLRGLLKRQAINSLIQAAEQAVLQNSSFIQAGFVNGFFSMDQKINSFFANALLETLHDSSKSEIQKIEQVEITMNQSDIGPVSLATLIKKKFGFNEGDSNESFINYLKDIMNAEEMASVVQVNIVEPSKSNVMLVAKAA